MQRLDSVRQNVDVLYSANHLEADQWIHWGYPNHVLVVAEQTEKLANQHGANIELAVTGALLHDIADAVMSRFNPEHEERSLKIAGDILAKSGFTKDETHFVREEILRPHSCKKLLPTTIEGKVMATADSMAHFVTDFYLYFCWQNYGPGDYEDFIEWVPKKIEKDFTRKIFFDDAREAVRPKYEALKILFKAGKDE